MRTITEVERPLNNVYTISKAFVGKSEDGKRWVVKGWREAEPATRLHMVREYVAGNLACWLGLPWPSFPEWVRYPPGIGAPLRHPIEPGICVATEFLPDLKELPYPIADPALETSNDRFIPIPDEDRLRLVRDTLRPFLALSGNLATIYGRLVFDKWLSEIDPMMDALQVRENGTFVSLDASTALHPRQEAKSIHRQQRHYCIHQAYLGWNLCGRAVLTERIGFEPWLLKLLEFDNAIWDSLVAGIPSELSDVAWVITGLKSEVCNTKAFVDEFVLGIPYLSLA